VNFFQFADENPLDPKVGVLTRNLAFGENAYVVRGQANMTIAGQDHPVTAGDLKLLK